MRNTLIAAAVLTALASAAMAQTQTPPAQNGPQNGAVNSSDQKVNTPVKGRNSFTEGEAKSRIEKNGFTNVSQLRKDDNGVWRGRAMKNGAQVDVALDYQGNVVTGNSAQGNTAPGSAARGTAGR
jgi:opacity protein-like surface antigen